MRQFQLVDDNGNRFNLTVRGAAFFNSPAGLGFNRESDYVRVGGAYVRVGRDVFSQGQITGEIVIKGYTIYPNLTNYLLGRSYKIEYTDGVHGYYFRDVDIISLEKTELNSAGLLILPVTFACKSRWYQVVSTTFTDTKNVLVTNDSLLPAPWRLTVDVASGLTVPGQTVELYYESGGSRITLQKVSVDKPNRGGRLVWDTRDGYARCIWSGENMVPVMDFTKNNFFKIPVGEFHFSIYGYSGSTTTGTFEYFKEWETV